MLYSRIASPTLYAAVPHHLYYIIIRAYESRELVRNRNTEAKDVNQHNYNQRHRNVLYDHDAFRRASLTHV